jgi:hypothetical protein
LIDDLGVSWLVLWLHVFLSEFKQDQVFD